MEELEDAMTREEFTEQEYIDWMATFKGLFEMSNEEHKKNGCFDHPTEENEDDDDDNTLARDIPVHHFPWRGTDYFIETSAAPTDPSLNAIMAGAGDGHRSLFSGSTYEEVGYVSSEGAVTFFTTDDD